MRRAFVIMSTFNPSPQNKVLTDSDLQSGAVPFNPQTQLTSLINYFTGRSAQQQLQSNQQEFDEYMYNQYNSPEALVRQFNDAGLNTNLLGSTSFGTAQSSAAAPSVNPVAAPAKPLSEAVANIGSAVASVAGAGLDIAQIPYYESLPALNKALEAKYGAETQLTDQEFKSAKQLFDWSLQDREFNVANLRLGYYQNLQNYERGWQEFDNLVKDGQILDNEIERSKWESKMAKESYETWVKYHILPSTNFMDWLNASFVYGHNEDAFERYVRGFGMLHDSENQSGAKYGKFGGKVKVGPLEVSDSFIQYCIEKGYTIKQMLDAAKGGDMPGVDSSASSSSQMSDEDMTPQKAASLMWQFEDEYYREHPYGDISKRGFKKYLLSKGFTSEFINSHWSEIWHIFDKAD